MHPMPLPLVADLVLVGGGHAHALVLRMWGMNPLPGVRLTVINPDPVAPYTGMLPGHIAGHYRRDDLMIDLVRLAGFAGANLILDRVTGIDPARRRIQLSNRPEIAYDLASVDIGITSDLPAIPGFAEHAVAAKPLGAYAARWEGFLTTAPEAPHLVIIGAGLAGVELALASHHRLRGTGRKPQVTLIDTGAEVLGGLGSMTRASLLAELAAADVRLLTGTSVSEIGDGHVRLVDGQRLPSDFTLTAAGARPQLWMAKTGLALTDGFLTIDRQLQTSDPAIFAAGDCAHLAHAPRPKAGVFAVRQAPVLLHNLRAALSGGKLRPFRPQSEFLKLISLGTRRAIADRPGLSVKGGFVWHWKDRIDRAFMAKFADYPVMAQPPVPEVSATGLADLLAGKPLCGGCGAKVAGATLAGALSAQPAPSRPDVLTGPGDDAAVLRHGQALQVITTDHLRSFCQDPWLMARITAIHALGDIWAMGARPQAALAQITLPPLSAALQAETLSQIMAAATAVFRDAGADLVGGHTSQGAELTVGFTVTGLAEKVISKGGAKPGEVLILSKPLGTGTILAASMAGARLHGALLGEILAGAQAKMVQPLDKASDILAPYASAMTDVTGFGLAGHVLEMLEASGCAADIDLAAVPLLPGALELSLAGQSASLAPANRAACQGRMALTGLPAEALLFDPQTAGGLLAAVPADRAKSLLDALGPGAAIIGRLTTGAPMLRVIG